MKVTDLFHLQLSTISKFIDQAQLNVTATKLTDSGVTERNSLVAAKNLLKIALRDLENLISDRTRIGE